MRAIWRLAVPLAFGVAGVLFVTSADASRGGDLRGDRSNLADLIKAEQQRADDAAERTERLRAEVARETDRLAAADRRIQAQLRRGDDLGLAAGVAPVRGPGLSVTLADAPRSADRLLPEGTTPDDLVVHQQDVQAVVNALWAGGAEAMQIMDQRVVSTSAVRCVGNTLILQGRVYSPPYTVTAIGDPQRLSRALDSSEQVQLYRYYADQYGLVYRTESKGEATLPAFDGSLDLEYAQPVA